MLHALTALSEGSVDPASIVYAISRPIEQHPSEQEYYVVYGQVLERAGLVGNATDVYSALVQRSENEASPTKDGILALVGHARVLCASTRFKESAATYRRAIAAFEHAGPSSLVFVGFTYVGLGIALFHAGDAEGGLVALRSALAIAEKAKGLSEEAAETLMAEATLRLVQIMWSSGDQQSRTLAKQRLLQRWRGFLDAMECQG
jgi:hypothetical protein